LSAGVAIDGTCGQFAVGRAGAGLRCRTVLCASCRVDYRFAATWRHCVTSSPVIRIWDLPIRLFHWLLAISVLGAFVTVKVGGFWMDYHLLFGYAVLALLIFRLVWGLIGSRHARFLQFVRGPRVLYGYLAGRQPYSAGHSPLGALSVLAMLASLAVQAVTGLFTNDGIMNEGPMASQVSGATSDRLSGIHHLNEQVML